MGIGDLASGYMQIEGAFEKRVDGCDLFTARQKNTDKKISLIVSQSGFFSWFFSRDLVRLHVKDDKNWTGFRVVYVTADSVRSALKMSPKEEQGLGRAISSMLQSVTSNNQHLPSKANSKSVFVQYTEEKETDFIIQETDQERFSEIGLILPKEYIGKNISVDNKEEFLKKIVQLNRESVIRHPKNITPEEVHFLQEFREKRDLADWYDQSRERFSALATTPGLFVDTMSVCKKKFQALSENLEIKPLMGRVLWVPNEYSFHMPGLALVASYRAEKKGLKGLYVCEHVQAFSDKMKEIAEESEDGRYAFVLPVLPSGIQRRFPELCEDYPQHKVAVCVEKKGGELKVAIMDPQPQEESLSINPDHLVTSGDDPWEGFEREGAFTSHELVMRALKGATQTCKPHVYIAMTKRESSFGCAVFALSDAETFLEDADFFSRIQGSEDEEEVAGIGYRYIDILPPEYMVGTQSLTRLADYERSSPGISQQRFETKKKNLEDYASKYHRMCGGRELNQYIMWKVFLYSHLVNKALSELSPEAVQKKVQSCLLSKAHD
jgi:hypothetical protein